MSPFFSILLHAHSGFRWLLLIILLVAIYKAFTGNTGNKPFTKSDNTLRLLTVIFTHLQLIIGLILYIQSPLVKFFWGNPGTAITQEAPMFFGLFHFVFMLLAVIFITIGSAKTKKKHTDKEKFKTMRNWFLAALIIILLAIPWPYLPTAGRALF
ncbi:MAG: hypothetical protein JST63_15835 [Bacteroidetes bacterium]|nr:hypothetical protein [Bacteroidota bacterium]